MEPGRLDNHEPIPPTKSGGMGPEPRGEHGRALVLGFDAEFAAVVCDVLSHAFELRMTTRLEVALGLLASRQYDAVIVESNAPGAIPLRALIEQIRTWQPDAGIVITSQRPLLSCQIVECFTADADDYILAPFHPGEFLARIVRRTVVRQGVAARRSQPTTSHGCDGHHDGLGTGDAADRPDEARRERCPETRTENVAPDSYSYGTAHTRELASAVG